jgi:calcineurin-like phosphoesterase family protein
MLEFKNYNGLLFVGDPHLWSLKPARRMDENFSETVLKKIENAVDIANKKNLYLIFLGDLFHKENESNIEMLTKLSRILRKLKDAPATVEGNHEKSQTKLSDDVALSLLRENRTIYTIENNDLWAKFYFNDGTECYVGGTPYGEKIPKEVSLPKKETKKVPIIWLTHHNLDFGESYPGVIKIEEIKGVSMLINGHIHKTKKPQNIGKMRAHNPGNITRLSKDCIDHIPAVWEWNSSLGWELEPHIINYHKIVFDMMDSQIEVELLPEKISTELTPQQTSQFVDKMNEFSSKYDPNKTDDGTIIKENIIALVQAMNLDKEFLKEMISIAEETIQNEINNT